MAPKREREESPATKPTKDVSSPTPGASGKAEPKVKNKKKKVYLGSFTVEENLRIIQGLESGESVAGTIAALGHRHHNSVRQRRKHFVDLMYAHAGK